MACAVSAMIGVRGTRSLISNSRMIPVASIPPMTGIDTSICQPVSIELTMTLEESPLTRITSNGVRASCRRLNQRQTANQSAITSHSLVFLNGNLSVIRHFHLMSCHLQQFHRQFLIDQIILCQQDTQHCILDAYTRLHLV